MNLSLILFLIGILGFVLNRKNIILMLISIEIMLLAITLLILISSLSFDDILGQTYAIYVIAIAGAESAIGLGILVAFYRFYSNINPTCLSHTYSCNSEKNISSFSRSNSFISTSNARNAKSYSTSALNRGSKLKQALTCVSSPQTLKDSDTEPSINSFLDEKVITNVLGFNDTILPA